MKVILDEISLTLKILLRFNQQIKENNQRIQVVLLRLKKDTYIELVDPM